MIHIWRFLFLNLFLALTHISRRLHFLKCSNANISIISFHDITAGKYHLPAGHCLRTVHASRLLRLSGGRWVMRKLPEWLFGISFQTPWMDSQRHVWSWRDSSQTVQNLRFLRGGWRWRSFRWNGRRDRMKEVKNTKSSLVLVGAAFRGCWETGKKAGEMMTITPRALDVLVFEVNQTYLEDKRWNYQLSSAVNIQLWSTVCIFFCAMRDYDQYFRCHRWKFDL